MKRLGTVIHRVGDLLIIKVEKSHFSEKSIVFTKKMKKIGKIKEIFGPVKSPYVSVSIYKQFNDSDILELYNQMLYIK